MATTTTTTTTTGAAVPGFERAKPRRGGLSAHRERAGGEGMEPSFLGLTLFVASEVMFFAALFATYFNFKANATEWPGVTFPGGQEIEKLNLSYAAWLTVVLVSSSVVMQLAIVAIRRNWKTVATGLIALTLMLGTGFVIGQAVEWNKLTFNIKDGIYPSLFYTITGFHGLHVIGGLVAITFLLPKAVRGEFDADNHTMLEAVSFYWHFVDVVWVGVFSILYWVH
jgi:cytochrome c oxidase subunit 3